jgi:hypothetical protein
LSSRGILAAKVAVEKKEACAEDWELVVAKVAVEKKEEARAEDWELV